MSLTENLKPGPDADRKGTVGENIPELAWTTLDLPPETCERAMRRVAARARDAADALLLLDAFGLIKPDGNGWKRAGKEVEA